MKRKLVILLLAGISVLPLQAAPPSDYFTPPETMYAFADFWIVRPLDLAVLPITALTWVASLPVTAASGTQEQAEKLYEDFYANSPFVFLSPEAVDVKQVVNTNKCFLNLQVHEGQILISSVIDNLIKGASGQAVQNMNLMLGWQEDAGLKLKAIGF
jgi:hypothetical protein